MSDLLPGPGPSSQTVQPLPQATAGTQTVIASQGGAVSQNIGHAQITIIYNRPVARGREIFGALIPWDEVWHPGADRATYLRTSADLLVGGQRLPAGSYSLWVIPTSDEWTLIFHEDWDVFHFPYPGDEGVVARLALRPEVAEHMETLAYYFPVADARKGTLALHWADTRILVPIEAPRADEESESEQAGP